MAGVFLFWRRIIGPDYLVAERFCEIIGDERL